MDLQSYLKLTHLLKSDTSKKEQRRAFFLKHQMQKLSKTEQLLLWMERASHLETQQDLHLKSITGVLFFISFIVGLFTAAALLSYSGEEPVNVIYFFTIAVIVPLFSMLLSFFALFFPKYFTPLFLSVWIQKLLLKLFSGDTPFLKIDQNLKYAFTLFIVQFAALLFSTGLFLGFLAIVFTQDIAFGWSTTLNITPDSFYSFLHTLTLPFATLCPDSIVSLELIERSHYFRLGQTMSQQMSQNASLFGEWWKFLACSTLFYAVVLRFVFLLIAYIRFKRSLLEALLHIDGAQNLLRDMNEALISTKAEMVQESHMVHTSPLKTTDESFSDCYATLGWAFQDNELLLATDALHLPRRFLHTLGGNKSLKEDTLTVKQMQGQVLLLVKAWEVPTMEFIDLVEDLLAQVEHLIVYPLGYAQKNYKADSDDLAVWEQKIAAQNFKNVSIKK